MVVASISGIRGIFNQDLVLTELARYIDGFTGVRPSAEFLVGRDSRHSGEAIARIVSGALAEGGARVVDFGVLSTPALFRESRLRGLPAVMITASHNEPEWNGIKFISGGRGITQPELDGILAARQSKRPSRMQGSVTYPRAASYNREVVEMAGKGSAAGVSVALDLNGGAAIRHAPPILEGLGCRVKVLGGSEGIFNRVVDPTSDDLNLLRGSVREGGLDVGFAFDCDGDRLVLVDNEGEKKTGDFMLALVINKLLPERENRRVVVSVDTTRAIDDIVSQLGGTVYRSKVGEANVVSRMIEEQSTLGGEGSSGGLIDGSYNYCRDSMIAATVIVRAIKKSGHRVFREIPSYSQVRLKVSLERRKALAAIKRLQREHPEADMLDGMRIDMSAHSWVLIRVSGTEDAVRVSAESTSAKEAQELADSYLKKVKELG